QNTSGGLGVATFFVISGFLVTASMDRSRNWFAYVRARLLRVYPALIVMVLLTVFVLGPLVTTSARNDYFSQPQTYEYFRVLLLYNNGSYSLPGVFETNIYPNTINGSLWTLYWEMLCYGLILVLWLAHLFRKQVILALGLAMIFVRFAVLDVYPVFLFHKASLDSIYAFFNYNYARILTQMLSYFMAGTVFYVYRDKIPMRRRYVGLALILMVISIIAGTGLFTFWFPTFGAYLLFYAASSQRSPFRRFSKHGDFSYGMYIYAFPVQQSLSYIFGGAMAQMLNFALATPITLILAIFSWHIIEKPALRLKHRSSRSDSPSPELRDQTEAVISK
ncbi:MAG: acyltransferase, partial [Chloroflexota bacterium]